MFMDRRGRRFRRKKVRRMGMKRLLVVGATGDVGQGIVASASSLGWSVIAAGRNADQLSRFESDGKTVAHVIGDVESAEGADSLWTAATGGFGGQYPCGGGANAPHDLRTPPAS